MKQLSNPGYIKLCGDGTFRLILGDWVLMNLPALTKHYAPVSGAGAFRPTFSPLLFGIANKESCPSYKALFDGASHCAHVCLDIDLPPRVCQYHCDWHAGEDAARRQCRSESLISLTSLVLVSALAFLSAQMTQSKPTGPAFHKL